MATSHPGFKKVASQIASKEGVSKERAGAMLAASTRRASAGAKKSNPHLKRVMKGGNTSISTSSMKGKALSQDRQANLASKDAFCGCCRG